MLLLAKAQADEELARKIQAEEEAAAQGPDPTDAPIEDTLHIDELKIELGYALLPLINDVEGRRLTDQIKALRRKLHVLSSRLETDGDAYESSACWARPFGAVRLALLPSCAVPTPATLPTHCVVDGCGASACSTTAPTPSPRT